MSDFEEQLNLLRSDVERLRAELATVNRNNTTVCAAMNYEIDQLKYILQEYQRTTESFDSWGWG